MKQAIIIILTEKERKYIKNQLLSITDFKNDGECNLWHSIMQKLTSKENGVDDESGD